MISRKSKKYEIFKMYKLQTRQRSAREKDRLEKNRSRARKIGLGFQAMSTWIVIQMFKGTLFYRYRPLHTPFAPNPILTGSGKSKLAQVVP